MRDYLEMVWLCVFWAKVVRITFNGLKYMYK